MAIEVIYSKIALVSLNQFNTLPKTGKPTTNEWTVLSTIVQEHVNGKSKSNLSVVALGTGTKCLGSTKMCSDGTILNDSHAEVVCRRAFIKYLYREMDNLNSDVLTFHERTKKFKLNDGFRFHFFTTHVPCGDAAIFPKQNSEDFGDCVTNTVQNNVVPQSKQINEIDEEPSTKKQKINHLPRDIFRTGAKCVPNNMNCKDSLQPGIGYHLTGVVRTKPGRGEPTLSLSCSDKIAIWCHLGIQGALMSTLLSEPLFLYSFIIVGNTPFDVNAAKRAFWERIKKIDVLPAQCLVLHQVDEHFNFSKCQGIRPASSSIIFSKNSKTEVSVDGKRQGITKKNMHSNHATLSISKLSLYKMYLAILAKYAIPISTNMTSLKEVTNDNVKSSSSYSIHKKLLFEKGFNVIRKKNKRLLNLTK